MSEFAGTVEMSGSAFGFRYGINGGTWIANSTAVLYDNLSVSNATLVLKGDHSGEDAAYSIGANGVLKTADNAMVPGITFTAGSTLEMLDDGALSDTTQTYVALTSKTPISGSLPTLVQPEGNRGKWKLVVTEVTENDTTVYQLCAEFRPAGFIIIVQ